MTAGPDPIGARRAPLQNYFDRLFSVCFLWLRAACWVGGFQKSRGLNPAIDWVCFRSASSASLRLWAVVHALQTFDAG